MKRKIEELWLEISRYMQVVNGAAAATMIAFMAEVWGNDAPYEALATSILVFSAGLVLATLAILGFKVAWSIQNVGENIRSDSVSRTMPPGSDPNIVLGVHWTQWVELTLNVTAWVAILTLILFLLGAVAVTFVILDYPAC